MRVEILIVSLAVCGAALAGGCRDGSGRSGDTLPPPVSTTATTAVSYDVPAVIDAAYAGKVMQALDHLYGEAVRHLAQVRAVDEQFLKYLVATHNPRIFSLAQDLWVRIQAKEFAGLAATPGDPHTRIDRLLRADRECMLIQGDQDLTPLYTADDPTNHHRYVALTPLAADRNPDRLNLTPWTVNFSGEGNGGSLPGDACVPQ
ncbi:MAG TPA: hypothetical protein VGO92_01765 [Acidimicrobiales bacterium]|nr:hypothetical protein [Acidimicrobiales bacterium]